MFVESFGRNQFKFSKNFENPYFGQKLRILGKIRTGIHTPSKNVYMYGYIRTSGNDAIMKGKMYKRKSYIQNSEGSDDKKLLYSIFASEKILFSTLCTCFVSRLAALLAY